MAENETDYCDMDDSDNSMFILILENFHEQ